MIHDEFSHIKSSNKRWKLRHPERKRKSDLERRHRYEKKHPEKALLKRIKARAKRSGIYFDLVPEDIQIPTHCPVLGIELQRGKDGINPNSPSVDRFDNTKGYTRDNIRIISWRANTLKRDATIEEIEAILRYMKQE